MKADQEYEEFRVRRIEQQKLAEEEMVREKIMREAKFKEYETEVHAERMAREAR